MNKMGAPEIHLTAKLCLDLLRASIRKNRTSNNNQVATNTWEAAQDLQHAILLSTDGVAPSPTDSNTNSDSGDNSWVSTHSQEQSDLSLSSSFDVTREEDEAIADSPHYDSLLSVDELEDDEVDRSRAGATAGLLLMRSASCNSNSSFMERSRRAESRSFMVDQHAPQQQEHEQFERDSCSPESYRGREFESCSRTRNRSMSGTTALDEIDHPALTGAVAALHGFVASGGDSFLLEKAYDLARGVAASKQDVLVAFDACRIALAAGYVHSLQNSTEELAHEFVLYHSLPRLAKSLEVYWSRRGQWVSPAEMREWEQVMQSLLEVTSSVSLVTRATDVVSVLDAEVGEGVAQALGKFCVANPDIVSDYNDVARVCVERHLSVQTPDKASTRVQAQRVQQQKRQQQQQQQQQNEATNVYYSE